MAPFVRSYRKTLTFGMSVRCVFLAYLFANLLCLLPNDAVAVNVTYSTDSPSRFASVTPLIMDYNNNTCVYTTSSNDKLDVYVLMAMFGVNQQLLMYNAETYTSFYELVGEAASDGNCTRISSTTSPSSASSMDWLGNNNLRYVNVHLVPIKEVLSVTSILKRFSASSAAAAAADAAKQLPISQCSQQPKNGSSSSSFSDSKLDTFDDHQVVVPKTPPIAYVLAGYLGTSDVKPISKITDFYNIPLISSQSTSPELSVRSVYPRFFRTCPSQKEEKYVLLNTLQHFGYTQVNTVFFGDTLSMDIRASIEPHLLSNGIVIEHSLVYSAQNLRTYKNIYNTLTSESATHVWLAFVPNTFPTTRNLLCALASITAARANQQQQKQIQSPTLLGATHQLIAYSVKTETLWWHPNPNGEFLSLNNAKSSTANDYVPEDFAAYGQNCTLSQVQNLLDGALFTNTPNLDEGDRPLDAFTTSTAPNQQKIIRPSQFVKAIRKAFAGNNRLSTLPNSMYVDPLHFYHFDAITAAAYALDEAERIMRQQRNGSLADFRYDRSQSNAVMDALGTIAFQGVTGNVQFTSDGDRTNNDRILLQFQGSEFVPVGYFNRKENPAGDNLPPYYANITITKPLLFPTADGSAPLQFVTAVPWLTTTNLVVIIVAAAMFGCVILPVAALCVRKQVRESALRAALNDMNWRIDASQLGLTPKSASSRRFASKSMLSTNSFSGSVYSQRSHGGHSLSQYGGSDGTTVGEHATNDLGRQYLTFMYRGDYVFLFPLQPENESNDNGPKTAAKTSVTFDREFVREVLKMKSFSNDNVTRFVGIHSTNDETRVAGTRLSNGNAVTTAQRVSVADNSEEKKNLHYVVMAGSRKGMLSDFIQQAAVHSASGDMDEACSFSLLHDLQQGLSAVHKVFGFHGRLTSMSCVVDQRLMLKVCDYGFSHLRHATFYNVSSTDDYEHWLWTAPEQLSSVLFASSFTATSPPVGDERTMSTTLASPLVSNKNGASGKFSISARTANNMSLDQHTWACADIYSFGVIASEIFTQGLPFDEQLRASATSSSTMNLSTYQLLKTISASPRLASHMARTALLHHNSANSSGGGGSTTTSIGTDIIDTIVNCMAAVPTQRPNLTELDSSLRFMMRKRKISSNFTEMLMKRLETHAANLETMVEQRTQALMEEENKVRTLLYQILPPSVADSLKNGQHVAPQTYDSVTVYFSDIVGFTALSATSTPLEVVDLLNDLYNTIDQIISMFDVYKVETIGDAYMVVSGLPEPNGLEHVRQIARLSVALVETITTKFKIRHRPGEQLKMRIGMHSGACAAGVVGFVMPRYCLFGDTINTASRMESTGAAQRIHVSEASVNLLMSLPPADGGEVVGCIAPAEEFAVEVLGEVEIKGKGAMKTYWLTSRLKKLDGVVSELMER